MNKWIKAVGLTVIAGCTSVSEQPVSIEHGAGKEVKPVEKAKAERSTAIDPNTLYLLLAAELAGQRKQYNIALDAYLQAAKRVKDPRVAERAARIALYLKDQAKTEQAVKIWLQEDPDNLTARKIALLSALRNADKAQAVQQLEAYLRLDPAGFESVLLEVAKVMSQTRREQELVEILDELASQHPDLASIYYVQALLATKQKNDTLALAKINQALAVQPGWKKALILRAQIAVHARNFEAAEQYLQAAVEQYPDDLTFKKMLAQVFMEEQKYDQALDLYQDVLDKQAGDGESLFAKGLIYLHEDKREDAKAVFKKLVDQSAWHSQAAFYLGRIALEEKQDEKALVWFDSITSGPYALDARLAAISILMDQKRYKEVAARLDDLARDFPRKKVTLWLLKAELYNATGRQLQAYELLTDGLEKYPENKDLLYARSLIAEQLGMMEVVEQDLHKILAKHPNDAAALNALGYTLVDKTTRYDEAEKYLQQALALKPDSGVIIDSYGWLKYKQGDLQQALELIQKAYEKQPEPEIAAHLAEILWKMGRRDDAREVFDKAIEKAPDDKYLKAFEKRFLSAP